jgi:hypothetical protein
MEVSIMLQLPIIHISTHLMRGWWTDNKDMLFDERMVDRQLGNYPEQLTGALNSTTKTGLVQSLDVFLM